MSTALSFVALQRWRLAFPWDGACEKGFRKFQGFLVNSAKTGAANAPFLGVGEDSTDGTGSRGRKQVLITMNLWRLLFDFSGSQSVFFMAFKQGGREKLRAFPFSVAFSAAIRPGPRSAVRRQRRTIRPSAEAYPGLKKRCHSSWDTSDFLFFNVNMFSSTVSLHREIGGTGGA